MSNDNDAAPVALGGNSRERLASLARQISAHLDQAGEAAEEIKALKAEAKSEGFDVRVLGQVIKELRSGASFQAGQLEAELVLDTYRRALDLPVSLEAAQEAARVAAEAVPDKPRRGRTGEPANDDDDDGSSPPRKDLD